MLLWISLTFSENQLLIIIGGCYCRGKANKNISELTKEVYVLPFFFIKHCCKLSHQRYLSAKTFVLNEAAYVFRYQICKFFQDGLEIFLQKKTTVKLIYDG